jgi:WhiB family redox-sensing transcriptional regulator
MWLPRLPTPIADAWEWQLRGRCRDEQPAVFFPPEGERGHARASREQAAKRICHRCPVLDECRSHALSAGEPHGVWGGLSESERHLLGGGTTRAAAALRSRAPRRLPPQPTSKP